MGGDRWSVGRTALGTVSFNKMFAARGVVMGGSKSLLKLFYEGLSPLVLLVSTLRLSSLASILVYKRPSVPPFLCIIHINSHL